MMQYKHGGVQCHVVLMANQFRSAMAGVWCSNTCGTRANIPLVTVRREFTIPAPVIARAEYSPKLSWVALFAKAFALAAMRHPHLRRNWLSFPVGRIYEHPNSECVVLVEREWQGEEAVLGAKLRAPESMNLATIDGHIRRFKSDPVLSSRRSGNCCGLRDIRRCCGDFCSG